MDFRDIRRIRSFSLADFDTLSNPLPSSAPTPTASITIAGAVLVRALPTLLYHTQPAPGS